MAYSYRFAILFVLLSATVSLSTAALVEQKPRRGGIPLKGSVTLNLVWYGKFTPTQRSVIVDFIRSIGSPAVAKGPSVASWWKTTEKYKQGVSNLVVGKQLLLENYPIGKSLKSPYLRALSSKLNVGGARSITVVLTAKDVAVEGFCMNRCGTHGSRASGAYVWVGNSETQCPGYCAWPFHQPIYGPQSPPLVAPNGDVGVDGMIINLATLLVNTVTNPSQEAVAACTGVFGSGAYPGYAGRVLVDKTSGASYNALGLAGRKYLLPAMWDPQTSTCKTLV
ncbi:PREDICTED: protein EXORDIUM-like 4 [Camelina sativa]|uniref:Protein EXORDIUM-like 4 n=1 Tax=Camelina sativa TaxID=90675 RepID=A0ABM0V9G0_CAMSA|nr:PREDICTED: protein EXORDIUM-like 4 [Camelina sativa]